MSLLCPGPGIEGDTVISPGDISHWTPCSTELGKGTSRIEPGERSETQRSGGLAWFIQQEGDSGMWPQALGLCFIDLVTDVEGKKLLLMDKDQSFPLPCPVQGLSHGCPVPAALVSPDRSPHSSEMT